MLTTRRRLAWILRCRSDTIALLHAVCQGCLLINIEQFVECDFCQVRIDNTVVGGAIGAAAFFFISISDMAAVAVVCLVFLFQFLSPAVLSVSLFDI